MAMFDKRREEEEATVDQATILGATRARMPDPVSAAREIARIGKTITIEGNLVGEESLVIDGKIDGTILLKNSDLMVGQSGQVKADIKASVVRIEGEVTGDITGEEKVVITRTGRVLGNIVAPRVALEDGARFKGRIDMDPERAQRAATSTARKPVPVGQRPEVKAQPPREAAGRST